MPKGGMTKKAIKDAIERMPESNAALAHVRAILSGIEPPYIEGSKPPKMPKLKEPKMIGDKFNPLWLVELRDAFVRHNEAWFNFYGESWPEFERQVNLVHRMAKEHGINLRTFSPETFSFDDIRRLDDLFGMADKVCSDLEDRLRTSHEIGLRSLPLAKKKEWAHSGETAEAAPVVPGADSGTCAGRGREDGGDMGGASPAEVHAVDDAEQPSDEGWLDGPDGDPAAPSPGVHGDLDRPEAQDEPPD
jgi:hypothetical protein